MSTSATTPKGAPAAKKTSVSAEIVMGKAAQDLHKAVAEALRATEGLSELVVKSEDLALTIANQEAKISELDVQFHEKERQMALDLELRMKGRAEHTVQEHLAANRQRSILIEEFTQMDTRIKNAENELKTTVAVETAKVRNEEKSRFESERKLLEAQHAATEAKNNASITVLEGKITFLEAQNHQLLDQINAERDASIQRAKAATPVYQTVGGPANGGR